jgi:O-antigen ligase
VVVAALLGVGAVAVVLAVVPSTLFDLDRFSVPKELALLATALLTALIVLARADRIDVGVAELGLGAFAIWSTLTALGATNWWLAGRAIGVTWAGVALFIAARWAAERGARWLVVAGLALAVLAGGVSGLAQTYGWSSPLLADTRAPGGTLGNRNFMAHLMVLGLPLAGWLLATARRRIGIGTSLLLVTFAMAAIVLSRSRAAWVGLGAMVVIVVVAGLLTRGRAPRLPRGRTLALGGALLAGALAALIVPNSLEWRSTTPYRDSLKDVFNYREGSGRGRLIQYRNTTAMIRRHPVLGVGPGNWVVAYPSVTTRGDPSFNGADPMPTNPWPSSDWVALTAERGPVGGLLWLVSLASIAVIAIRRTRDPDPVRGVAALGALALLVGAAVQGLFDAVMLLAPPSMVVMAGLGALLPATRPVRTDTRGPGRRRAALLLLVILGGLGIKSLGQLQSIRAAGTGSPLARLATAVRFDPGSYRLNFLLAVRAPCPDAERYARRLASLYPAHPWPKKLLNRCGKS